MNVHAIYGLIYIAEILLGFGEGCDRPVVLIQGDLGAVIVEAFLEERFVFRGKNIVTLNIDFAVGARQGWRRFVISYRHELGCGACCDQNDSPL